MKTIRVAQDFSRYPAGRFVKDGPFSGELFRNKHLKPALQEQEHLVVDLDGARGYGSSFLEEAFGGLVRDGIPKSDLAKKLTIQVTNQSLKREILEYIDAAKPASA